MLLPPLVPFDLGDLGQHRNDLDVQRLVPKLLRPDLAEHLRHLQLADLLILDDEVEPLLVHRLVQLQQVLRPAQLLVVLLLLQLIEEAAAVKVRKELVVLKREQHRRALGDARFLQQLGFLH